MYCTLKLYTKRKEGGKGLVNISSLMLCSSSKIPVHIRKKTSKNLSECLRAWHVTAAYLFIFLNSNFNVLKRKLYTSVVSEIVMSKFEQ